MARMLQQDIKLAKPPRRSTSNSGAPCMSRRGHASTLTHESSFYMHPTSTHQQSTQQRINARQEKNIPRTEQQHQHSREQQSEQEIGGTHTAAAAAAEQRESSTQSSREKHTHRAAAERERERERESSSRAAQSTAHTQRDTAAERESSSFFLLCSFRLGRRECVFAAPTVSISPNKRGRSFLIIIIFILFYFFTVNFLN